MFVTYVCSAVVVKGVARLVYLCGRLNGTQLLDRAWRHLQQYVPKALRSRDADTKRFNQRFSVYLFFVCAPV